jgi:hypothetical protein
MKKLYIIAATVAAFTSPSAIAAQPQTTGPMTPPMKVMDHSAHRGAQMHDMMGKADRAKTPAESKKLMTENMAMMKIHMAEMSATMDPKPMVMPMSGTMPMDAAHMEKMGKHMAMMHQMMASLMAQQQLMMKSGR